jgi:anti-anti-sigma factor
MKSLQNLTTTPANHDILRLVTRNDLLSTTAGHVRKQFFESLNTAVEPFPAVVEIDLRGARMVDSVGLNLIVTVVKRVRGWNGAMRIVVDSQNVYRCLQFTRLDSMAEVVFEATRVSEVSPGE